MGKRRQPQRVELTYTLANFSKNCMKMKKRGPEKGASKSTNDLSNNFFLNKRSDESSCYLGNRLV